VHPKKVFWRKLFLVELFYQGQIYILIIIKRWMFLYPIWPILRNKSFHLIGESMCTFYELKSPKCKQPLNISYKGFFHKQVLDLHRPSKIVCQTSGHQNHHWSQIRTPHPSLKQTNKQIFKRRLKRVFLHLGYLLHG
jgi:hypothetical protein